MKPSTSTLCTASLDFLLNPKKGHAQLRATAQEFAKKHLCDAVHFDPKSHRKTLRRAASQGLLGLTIDPKYGGKGRDTTSSVIVHHELSKRSPGFCLSYLAHSILFAHNFAKSANASQKAKILPQICSGKKIGALALSEKNAGTDVMNIATTARRVGNHFVLNGSKIWITNGPIADYFLVYAKVEEKAATTVRDTKRHAIGCFLLHKGMKGFEVGPVIPKCGMQPAVMCELTFRDVHLPADRLIGNIQNSWRALMTAFEMERLDLAAMALGIADRCLEEMVTYSQSRISFGKPLHHYGQIQRYIAEGYTSVLAAKTLIYSVSVAKHINRSMTDAAKLFAAPIAKQTADNAIQVCGAMGYSGKMDLEQLWRDAKLLEIGGGTLEAHQKNIVKDLVRWG